MFIMEHERFFDGAEGAPNERAAAIGEHRHGADAISAVVIAAIITMAHGVFAVTRSMKALKQADSAFGGAPRSKMSPAMIRASGFVVCKAA